MNAAEWYAFLAVFHSSCNRNQSVNAPSSIQARQSPAGGAATPAPVALVAPPKSAASKPFRSAPRAAAWAGDSLAAAGHLTDHSLPVTRPRMGVASGSFSPCRKVAMAGVRAPPGGAGAERSNLPLPLLTGSEARYRPRYWVGVAPRAAPPPTMNSSTETVRGTHPSGPAGAAQVA